MRPLLLLLALVHACAAAMEFAGEPTVQKTLGNACFPVWDSVSATTQLTIALYEAHTKQWALQHAQAPLAKSASGQLCTTVPRPGLYRVVVVAMAPENELNNMVVPLLPVLVTGPVHYITTTAAPTAATTTTVSSSVAMTTEGSVEACACPCMTGPSCADIDKCFGVHCGDHGGACDASTGTCKCPAEYTGPNCQTPACSHHGFFSPLSEQCVCRTGWGGYSCQVCAVPPRHGHQYICVPTVRESQNNAVAYLLMAVSASDATDFLAGVKRADAQLPYHAIVPGSIGFDGQRYNCECMSEQDADWALRRTRLSPGELDTFNATIVECISAANATEQQTTDMIELWTTCVSFQQQGLLTNGWWIACIILGIVALAELIALIMSCVVWSSQARTWRELSTKYV
jgi:hypothetical protein